MDMQQAIDQINNTATPLVMLDSQNRPNLSPDLSPYERLVNIRTAFGLPGPHEFVYYPEHNPVMPAYEEMLFAPADWRSSNE